MNPEARPRIRVFVSSTHDDLASYRDHCIHLFERLRDSLGIDWIGMELFGGDDRSPKDLCLARVKECDVYLGIFGMRYGSVDRESGQSITELEFREARRIGLPCMIYLIDEKNCPVLPVHVDRGETALKLADLKQELRDLTKGHVVQYFASPGDLCELIAVDMTRMAQMFTRSASTGGFKDRIEKATQRATQFILDMEIRPLGGWAYHGTVPTAWDTAYSLLALISIDADEYGAVLHRGQQVLLGLRNQHGGWRSPWERNPEASSITDTAVALTALLESGYSEQPWEVTRSAEYLLKARCPGQGWPDAAGTSTPSTASTAWATRALVRFGHSAESDWAQEVRAWLIGTQQQDGGWSAGPHATHSTIGKTRDAVMALSLLGGGRGKDPIDAVRPAAKAKAWLQLARRPEQSPEEFGSTVGVEPHGINPGVEAIILFLEAAFHLGVPASDDRVMADLDWLARRRTWSYTPQALCCLSQYRPWIANSRRE